MLRYFANKYINAMNIMGRVNKMLEYHSYDYYGRYLMLLYWSAYKSSNFQAIDVNKLAVYQRY